MIDRLGFLVDNGKADEGHQADGCTWELFWPHAKCWREQDQTEDQYKIRQGSRQCIFKDRFDKAPFDALAIGLKR